MSSLPAVTG